MKRISISWSAIIAIALGIALTILLICSGAIKVNAQECAALTKSSNFTKQCQRQASSGSKFCYQHQNTTMVVTGVQPAVRTNQCTAMTKASGFKVQCKKTAVKGATMCEIHQRINHQTN